MTHHTDAELLPCPFCGTAAKAVNSYEDDDWRIECWNDECSCHGKRCQNRSDAVFEWNRRAPGSPVPQGWKLVPDDANMTDEQAEAICAVAKVCGGGAYDIYRAALAAAPQPPEAAPSSVSNGRWPDAPPQENIRGGAPYSDPEFEKLAREHAVWGTAQSALCAQFWLAALAQRVPLSDRKIRQIDAHSGLDAIEFARAIERAHGIKEQST